MSAPGNSADFDQAYRSPILHWFWTDVRVPAELKRLVAQVSPLRTLELGCGLGRNSRLAVGMVAFSDVALLSYDALLIGKGRRAGGGLAFAEAFIGTLQTGFGLVTASRADPQDRALVLSMTAIPAALTTYGILALALPKAKEQPSGGRAQTPGAFASLPHLGFAPLRGGMMMHAFGDF